MEFDPRSEFMALSNRVAEGEVIHDGDLPGVEEKDPEDPRQRFIRDSQRLAAGESMQAVVKGAKASRQIRNDAQRFNAGGKLNLQTLAVIEDEDETDYRQMLLDRMAAMADG